MHVNHLLNYAVADGVNSVLKLEQTPRNITTSATSASPLFDLPEKIRTKIYADVVTYNTPISIHKHSTSSIRCDGRGTRFISTAWRFTPPLLRTCHRIRDEAAPIFYSNNVFIATARNADFSELISWLQETNIAYLGQVKHFILNIEPTSFADLLEMARATNIEVIRPQARKLYAAIKHAGFTLANVKVSTPKMNHMSKDALRMHFDIDDAENIRMRWLSAFEDELNRIGVDGLVDQLQGLIVESAKP